MSTVLNYAEAEVQFFKSLEGTAEQHIIEQSIYRLSLVKEKSPGCLEKTGYCNSCSRIGRANDICSHCQIDFCDIAVDQRCLECGCNTIELSFAKDSCSGGCYPPRMDKKEWEQFKKLNNLSQLC